MLELRANQIRITIESQNPVEDLYSFQQALMKLIQAQDISQMDNSGSPLYYGVELLKNILPDDRQQRKLLL